MNLTTKFPIHDLDGNLLVSAGTELSPEFMQELCEGNPVNPVKLRIDTELEDSLRAFKTENSAEVECRREMLRYKRRIDDVVRELQRTIEGIPQT